VLLVHQSLGGPAERAAVHAASAVVATSAWTRDRLADLHGVGAVVAPPGVDPVAPVPGTPGGRRLLCVGAVTPGKGQDVLVDVLAGITEPWHLTLVGSCEIDAGYAASVSERVDELGIKDRVTFVGPLVGESLGSSYEEADLLVSASRAESYGMAIAEALAHGLPVVAIDVGGVRESLGWAADGSRPGALVPAGDPAALRHALHRWLTDDVLRGRWRRAARSRRATLPTWDGTAAVVADVLARVCDLEPSR
jgi:glycosyltransferase involved in cell wall biosynthesis